jgi:L,D-transpeptidase YcbB
MRAGISLALFDNRSVRSGCGSSQGASMAKTVGLRAAVVLITVLAVSAAACRGGAKERERVSAALRKAVTTSARQLYVTKDAEGRKLWKLTQQFYERRRYAAAWIQGTDPKPQMQELIKALTASANEGLDPQLYSVSLLEHRRQEASRGFLTKKGFDPNEAGALDAWLTYLYMKYSSDLADGLSDLAHADPRWQIKAEKFDLAGRLEKALDTNTVNQSLTELLPENPQYRALRKVLADYKALAARPAWPVVPSPLKLKPRARSTQVGLLAQRLAASGDYTGRVPAQNEAATYGPELQEAVRRFQRRHGLADDGIVTPAVVAEMNVPLSKRIEQIQLNLERWRWLPRDLGSRYILVNIPEYRLEVWEGDHVALTMRVVVGKQDTPTPIFNDEMTYLVFSPYWNVPPDIAKGETLPEILKDPGFLQRTNMEVVDASGKVVGPSTIDLADPTQYRFRQRPGDGNSLGLVKFMFPNQYNVYLHDTPTDSLFARARRSFSHGCVRIEQPLALAEYVLRDRPDWTKERIEAAMQALEERTVKLRTPIPVYFGYWTARVSGDGLMQFRKDVYGIDARLTTMLADRLSRLRKTAAAAAMTANGVKPAKRVSGAGSIE